MESCSNYYDTQTTEAQKLRGVYRSIRLLPILSKLFQKTFLKTLKPIILGKNLIPELQFACREQNDIVEKVYGFHICCGNLLNIKRKGSTKTKIYFTKLLYMSVNEQT